MLKLGVSEIIFNSFLCPSIDTDWPACKVISLPLFPLARKRGALNELLLSESLAP